jgi:hypothetical protein
MLRFTVQRFKHGRWRTFKRARKKLNTAGAAKVSVKTSKAGRYRTQVSFSGDTRNVAARSAWTRFRVR